MSTAAVLDPERFRRQAGDRTGGRGRPWVHDYWREFIGTFFLVLTVCIASRDYLDALQDSIRLRRA